MNDDSKQESLVDQYIRQQKTSEAVKLLLDLIESNAKRKNFEKAEFFYEKLYEADPMALTEIVRAGEAIEEAKSQSVDKKHKEIWKAPYSSFSVTESNELYYGMETAGFEAGDVITKQGQISDRIFFIDKGKVKAVFSHKNSETLLSILEAGDFFGNEQFFSATVSTVSMIASGSVKISSLEKSILKKWKADAPALQSKLLDYCQKHDKIKNAIEEKNIDRREHTRIPFTVKMTFYFMGPAGEKSPKAYKAESSDISQGGLSFFIKTAKSEAVRMLLGRRVFVDFPVKLKTGESRILEKKGRITAVHSQIFDDFSIHLQFDAPINDSLFASILPVR